MHIGRDPESEAVDREGDRTGGISVSAESHACGWGRGAYVPVAV